MAPSATHHTTAYEHNSVAVLSFSRRMSRAEVAEGYRALKRDGGLYRVDLYPVSPNRVDGARLYFVGLEWGEAGGEVRVLLGSRA